MALNGVNNAEKIWNFLKAKGLSDYAASGVLGNLDAESGLNPQNLQDACQVRLGLTDEAYTKLVDSGVYARTQFSMDRSGYAICQWTWHTRKAALYDYAKARNKSVGDLEMQLEFFFKELSESFPGVLNGLKTAKSVREASDLILLEYECPADMSENVQIQRASIGQKYYNRFTRNQDKEVAMGYITFAKGKSIQLSKHFNSTEFDCHGNGCCSQTKINEKMIVFLEQIREHFNAPITITSPYRCSTHNRRVGGAVGSRHERGDACDIVVKGVAPRIVAQYAESIGILGIGLYESSKDGYFVHIDTRDYKSFWYGQSEQPRTTFGAYTGSNSNSSNIQNTNNLDTILNMGDRGAAVKAMQEKLIMLGYSCGDHGADGDFGTDTYRAVMKFQNDHNIADDGIAGSQTLTAIDKAVGELAIKDDSGFVGKTIRTTASLLNVRAGAGTSYRIVKQVKAGTTAVVVEEKSGWCKLSNPDGWVSKDYITKV